MNSLWRRIFSLGTILATHQNNQTLDQSEKHDQLRNEPSSNDQKSPAIPSRQSSSKVYIKLFPPERSTFSHFPQINRQVIWLIFVFFSSFPFYFMFHKFLHFIPQFLHCLLFYPSISYCFIKEAALDVPNTHWVTL